MKVCLTIGLAVSLLLSPGVHAKEYTFGIVPQQSAKKLARLWGPILARLSEDSGFTLKFATAKNIPTFEARLAAGNYAFAYMNPYHFTVFNESPGYLAIAHQENKSIQGIVVVHKDSKLQTLEELDGSTLAFPSPAAFAASLLPQAKLNNSNIKYEPRYVSSHDSVYMTVSRGLMPAGGGVMRTFNNTDPDVRKNLRILWKTEKYTPHAFAAHPDVPEADRLALQKALIELKNTESGVELLKSIRFAGIEPATDEDWDDVRDLNINILTE
ncbi:phosphate/phosphite/phosphonate ABC transporter substrate-binding protein [Granulosicoccus antarcticus]|uniref:Phosphate-import protein PhnD n=1 Tax=Granulosicoccus antarcticus IMCC3135 TaxID=1192854 RepID=A0A2Z2NN29_9GAMM|nr:phosphate/phosphite/phosphonate ABC transporter substrate-binding protein [Granulosicoccus antarcticus]ASJ72862.1 Phosphate-import protein PhnD [Granulosicoccus antarcticus IMCC3135]